MIKLQSSFVEKAQSASSSAELAELLGYAMQLEHSTIPPYLTALYSIHRNSNTSVAAALKEIAVEEMVHMTMVGNIITAIGGAVNITGDDFIPKYPDTLPMSVGDGLVVGLKKFSRELVHDVFMEIEKPENPIHFPVAEAESARLYKTIGEFYLAIVDKIEELGDGIFTGNTDKQLLNIDSTPPWDALKPIVKAQDAIDSLLWIIEDGEGTSSSPFDGSGSLAHYYRFEEVYHGRKLVKDAEAENGYSYSGSTIEFDETKVFDIPDNAKAADYAEGTDARAAVDYFNGEYSKMLRALQRIYDGHNEPADINAMLSVMAGLRTAAVDVVGLVDTSTGKNVGLTFEYTL